MQFIIVFEECQQQNPNGFTGHVSMNISILRTVVILNTHRIELLLISMCLN